MIDQHRTIRFLKVLHALLFQAGHLFAVAATIGLLRPEIAFAQQKKRISLLLIPNRKPSAASTISVCPYMPVNEHIGLGFRSNIVWNDWRVVGDTRLLYYPQYTWGLRGDPELDDRLLINYKYLRLYQTLYKEIRSHLAIGVGYMLDLHYDLDAGKDSMLIRQFTKYKYGTGINENSLSNGLSLNLLYDDRVDKGNYVQIAYRINPIILGNNNPWHSLYIDLRKYIRLSGDREHLLGFWTYYWSVFNSHTPFLDLPSTGWDPYQQRSARGFPQNRFRGNSILYGETEYRTAFVANGHLGFACFVNINSVAEQSGRPFTYFHPAAGGGIRLKFSKISTARLALDAGFSDGYAGIYLNLGNTF